jgi:hypothetical protein
LALFTCPRPGRRAPLSLKFKTFKLFNRSRLPSSGQAAPFDSLSPLSRLKQFKSFNHCVPFKRFELLERLERLEQLERFERS